MNQNTTQKTSRKLQLSRETLRELDATEAKQVVGGVRYLSALCTSMTCNGSRTWNCPTL